MVNTLVNFLLFSVGGENKQAAEETHSIPFLKLSKHKIVENHTQHFLTGLGVIQKRYAVTKAFFALKGRTDVT